MGSGRSVTVATAGAGPGAGYGAAAGDAMGAATGTAAGGAAVVVAGAGAGAVAFGAGAGAGSSFINLCSWAMFASSAAANATGAGTLGACELTGRMGDAATDGCRLRSCRAEGGFRAEGAAGLLTCEGTRRDAVMAFAADALGASTLAIGTPLASNLAAGGVCSVAAPESVKPVVVNALGASTLATGTPLESNLGAGGICSVASLEINKEKMMS